MRFSFLWFLLQQLDAVRKSNFMLWDSVSHEPSLSAGTLGLGRDTSKNISKITISHLHLYTVDNTYCFICILLLLPQTVLNVYSGCPIFASILQFIFVAAQARSMDIFDSDSTPRPGQAR